MKAAALLPLLVAACATDPAPVGGECQVADSTDVGDVTALKAQRCNVPSSMGKAHWWRLAATLPAAEIVQLELWDNRGAFAGDLVQPGTFSITGKELSPATCGVCLRAVVDKGLPTEREYFATGGTVEVSAVGPDASTPFVATITDATFGEVDANKAPVADGCTSNVARVKVTGAVEFAGGTGGGAGGSGGGGGGCKLTIAD